MTHKLSHIKDSIGKNYLGIKFNDALLEDYLMNLLDYVGEDEFTLITNNQQKRDHQSYHTTVLNVMEYNRAIKQLGMDLFMKKLDGAFSLPIDDIQMVGVGTAEKKGNRTYYVVLKSELLDEVRNSFGFPPKDLHITIGFNVKDVFGIPKDETTLID